MPMFIKEPEYKIRTIERLKDHYEIEKLLASKLRDAPKQQRQYLYSDLYDQLFKRVPDHPQLTRKDDFSDSKREVTQMMQLLNRFLDRKSIFLEVGPGDCKLSFEVTKHVEKVYAVDVSQEITKNRNIPKNFELIISDGCSVPLPDNSVTVAFSNQLMEHLHPDDVVEQLNNLYRVLAPNGAYVCLTPNRLAGPHDISRYFNDEIATGFHLKEYTHRELSKLFSSVGFSKLDAYIGGRGIYLRFPYFPIKVFESLLSGLPFSIRKKIASLLPIRALLGVILVARKKS
jgi:ubiquinone/menaquinone biosynthesis C-methylase UbiE